MSSIFSKIITGEIPCVKVAENERCIAFMDIHPLKNGHVLVVPKNEIDEFYELEDIDLSELILFSKKICKAMKKTFQMRIGMFAEGFEVPHAHIHLFPMRDGGDFIFNYPRLKLTQEELQEIANSIKTNL